VHVSAGSGAVASYESRQHGYTCALALPTYLLCSSLYRTDNSLRFE
jgi:hypothetical protein